MRAAVMTVMAVEYEEEEEEEEEEDCHSDLQALRRPPNDKADRRIEHFVDINTGIRFANEMEKCESCCPVCWVSSVSKKRRTRNLFGALN